MDHVPVKIGDEVVFTGLQDEFGNHMGYEGVAIGTKGIVTELGDDVFVESFFLTQLAL